MGEYYSPFKIKKTFRWNGWNNRRKQSSIVEHNVQEINEDESINIVLNVFEGKKNLLERINITGNYATNEDVIRGELIVDEGDPLTNLNLDKSIAKIKERRIFKDVSYEIKDGSQTNLKVININVEEQPTEKLSWRRYWTQRTLHLILKKQLVRWR